MTYEPTEFEKCELSTFSFDICLHSATGQPQLTIILQSTACSAKKGGAREEVEEEVEDVEEGERERRKGRKEGKGRIKRERGRERVLIK